MFMFTLATLALLLLKLFETDEWLLLLPLALLDLRLPPPPPTPLLLKLTLTLSFSLCRRLAYDLLVPGQLFVGLSACFGFLGFPLPPPWSSLT